MKLYILGPEGNGEGVYYLLTEEGEVLASHFCSHIGYASGDLEANRPERQKKWEKRFGKYKVLRLGDDEMTEEKLLELNHKNFDEKGNRIEEVNK